MVHNFFGFLVMYVFIGIVTDSGLQSTMMMRNWNENIGKTLHLFPQYMVQISLAVCMIKTKVSGTSISLALFWTTLVMTMAFISKELTLLTCTSGCGKPHLPGTQKIWTFTVSTTSTLEHPSSGMPSLQSMGVGWRGWLKVSVISRLQVLKQVEFFVIFYVLFNVEDFIWFNCFSAT